MTQSNDGTPPKTIAIVAYITLIGFVVALIMNSNNKSELGSFHIRQSLGIFILAFASGFIMIIPILGWIVGAAGYVFAFVLWILGLISAVNGELKPVPVLGDKFNEWFKGI